MQLLRRRLYIFWARCRGMRNVPSSIVYLGGVFRDSHNVRGLPCGQLLRRYQHRLALPGGNYERTGQRFLHPVRGQSVQY